MSYSEGETMNNPKTATNAKTDGRKTAIAAKTDGRKTKNRTGGRKPAWETPSMEEVSERVMAQPYIRFT